jgi:hypothetical protein
MRIPEISLEVAKLWVLSFSDLTECIWNFLSEVLGVVSKSTVRPGFDGNFFELLYSENFCPKISDMSIPVSTRERRLCKFS